MKTHEHPRNWASLAAFVAVHALIVGAGLAWASVRLQQQAAERQLPELRNEPVSVGPLRDWPEVVSDEQLRQVLYKLRPRLRGPRPKINHVDHALRFWGIEAAFEDPQCLSGVEMRELLLDHRRYRQVWGESEPAFLVSTRYGTGYRVNRGDASATHVDHTLAGLAEVGTPLDYPVITPDGETTLRSLVEDARRTFSLNQYEYEWSALVFVLYMPVARDWYTTEGQRINFDRLADRLMRQKLRQGVCYGNHRLHALVMLLRVDENHSILTPSKRRQVIGHLQNVTAVLVERQHEDGYWDRNWSGGAPTPSRARPVRSQRILATGHPMEWWSLAPEEVLPPKEVTVRAGQWLTRTILSMSDQEISEGFTFLSHAGRALALWRGRFPADVDLSSGTQDAR